MPRVQKATLPKELSEIQVRTAASYQLNGASRCGEYEHTVKAEDQSFTLTGLVVSERQHDLVAASPIFRGRSPDDCGPRSRFGGRPVRECL